MPWYIDLLLHEFHLRVRYLNKLINVIIDFINEAVYINRLDHLIPKLRGVHTVLGPMFILQPNLKLAVVRCSKICLMPLSCYGSNDLTLGPSLQHRLLHPIKHSSVSSRCAKLNDKLP